MLTLLKKDTFVKDIILLLLVSIVFAALFATGFAMATDKYFAKAVTGVIGDFGEYDLLFQTKVELKGAMARQIRQVIAERFPGATLRAGVSVVGKATFFLTLPSQYKTKAIYNSLSSYFNNLPGNGDFTIMTEPKLNISSVPSGVFDLLARQVENIPGVRFTFTDGSSIGVILKNPRSRETILAKIKKLLNKYQILEVRLDSTHQPEEMLAFGKEVTQSLVGFKGVGNAQDISMSGGSDYQYMMTTLLEVKKFLLAYTAEVTLRPYPGQNLEVGDLLVLNGQNTTNLKPGKVLEPLEVVVKVTTKDASGIHGLIIQGDAGFLRDNFANKLLPGDKIGSRVATVEVSSRKGQLVYAMDQGVKLLTGLNGAINDFNKTNNGGSLTISGIEKVFGQLAQVKSSLKSVESNLNGLTGKTNRDSLTKMVHLIDGIGDDLGSLAQTFGRVQVLENRFDQALQGLQSAQVLVGSPIIQSSFSQAGGIFDKVNLLNSQLKTVEGSLRSRVKVMDDFVNRFNPLVAMLVSWRDKAKDLAIQANNFGAVFTPGSANYQKLTGLIKSTDQVLAGLTGLDFNGIKSGLGLVSNQVFGSDKIDLSALITELAKVRDSLPRLLDEEIGHSVTLIDKYAGGETPTGERIQIFTNSGIDRQGVDARIKEVIKTDQVNVFSLPVGTIQPDIRGELFKILAEVRSTIAALIILILWVLSFILDQSLIISMFKQMGLAFLPRHHEFQNPLFENVYLIASKICSPANLYAAVIGGIWLSATFAITGAAIPYLNGWVIGFFGGIMGVLISFLAEKINPINKDEVMAGLSMGLDFKTIMREIVIPAGRPGMMQFLNRWKMVIK